MIKKVKKYSIINLVVTAISFLLYFILIKLQIDFLGIEKRGILILIQNGVGLFSTITRLGVNQSVLHELTIKKNNKILSNYYALSLFQMVLFIFLIVLTVKYNFGNSLELKAISIPFFIYFVSYFIYQTFTYFSFYLLSIWRHSVITILFNIFNITFLLLFNSHKTLESIIILLSSSHILCSLILVLYLPKLKFADLDFKIVRNLILNGLKIYGWSVFKDLIYKIDILLFSNKISQREFGIYTVIRDLLYNIWRVSDPITSSITKAYSEVRSKIDGYKKYILIYLFIALFVSPFAILLVNIYLKDYLKINTKILDANIYVVFFAFSLILFIIWKTLASLYVINNINKPVYVSIFLFFLALGAQYRFINNLDSVFFIMSVSYLIATIYLIYDFNNFNKIKYNENLL